MECPCRLEGAIAVHRALAPGRVKSTRLVPIQKTGYWLKSRRRPISLSRRTAPSFDGRRNRARNPAGATPAVAARRRRHGGGQGAGHGAHETIHRRNRRVSGWASPPRAPAQNGWYGSGVIISPFRSRTAARCLSRARSNARRSVPHVTGKFAAMLLAVTAHPAMLTYLNNVQSIGPEDSPAGRAAGAASMKIRDARRGALYAWGRWRLRPDGRDRPRQNPHRMGPRSPQRCGVQLFSQPHYQPEWSATRQDLSQHSRGRRGGGARSCGRSGDRAAHRDQIRDLFYRRRSAQAIASRVSKKALRAPAAICARLPRPR